MEKILEFIFKRPVDFMIISAYLLVGEACLLELTKPKVAFYYFLGSSIIAALGLAILLIKLTKELTQYL